MPGETESAGRDWELRKAGADIATQGDGHDPRAGTPHRREVRVKSGRPFASKAAAGATAANPSARQPIVIRLVLPPAAAVLTLRTRSITSPSSATSRSPVRSPWTPTIGP